jgi:hypothetical protein
MRPSIVSSRKAWWSLKRPWKASSNWLRLARRLRPGQPCQHLGVALAGDQRGQHGPAGDPKMPLATTLGLTWASSSSFSTRFFSAVLAATRSAR